MNSSSESKEQEQEQVNSPTGEEQISLGCEEASSKSVSFYENFCVFTNLLIVRGDFSDKRRDHWCHILFLWSIYILFMSKPIPFIDAIR